MKNLLIGGTSHTGKSTIAALIAAELGREVISTDSLARHPGRPWPTPASFIQEYFAALSCDTTHRLLMHHHENMWPQIQTVLFTQIASGNSAILEGSALRPEYMHFLDANKNVCVCLYASENVLNDRIRKESSYAEMNFEQRLLVEKFVERSQKDNNFILENAKKYGIECINSEDKNALWEFRKRMSTFLFG